MKKAIFTFLFVFAIATLFHLLSRDFSYEYEEI